LLTGDDLDACRRDAGSARDHPAQRAVRLAVDRGRTHTRNKDPIAKADKLVTPGARLQTHLKLGIAHE
jgi:hypothetical protein